MDRGTEIQGIGLGSSTGDGVRETEGDVNLLAGGDVGPTYPSESEGDDIPANIQQFTRGSLQYYLSDLLVFRSSSYLDEVLERTVEEIRRSGPRALLLISSHDDHLHVIHSCSYSNRSCRCGIFRYVTAQHVKRKNEARNLLSSKTYRDWYNVITYFHNNGRRIVYLEVGGGIKRYMSGDPNLQQGSCDGESLCGLVEIRTIEREDKHSNDIAYGTTLGPGGNGNGSRSGKRRRCPDEGIQATQVFLNTYPCTPLSNCVNTIPWLQDEKLKYERGNSDCFKIALSTFCSTLCTWNFFDFKIMYERQNCFPLFNCNSLDTSSMYYDVNTSKDILIELLMFQFGGQEALIKQFLQNLYNVCEKVIPKQNTFVVCSPPSAGKNFFFDAVLCFYLNKGQLGNPNKNNLFAFQEAVGKRILLWNEPNYESCMTDTLKMLLGGDQLTVKVKYLQDQTVNRTPVIVLTNNEVNFMNDPAFKDRIVVYRWQSAPFLKSYLDKPNPLAYIALLEHYDIV